MYVASRMVSVTFRARAPVAAYYALLAAMVVAPVLAVHVPVLGDDLNHLARTSILSRIGASPVLQRFYDAHWKFVPYYGMDLPMLAMARVMPVYAAGRIFAAICLLAPVAAVALLHAALHRRLSLVPCVAFLLCYNHLFELGFFNYLFSVSLAIALFAGWIAAEEWQPWKRSLVFTVGALGLYACHAFSFLVFGAMVAAWEIARALRRGSPIAVRARRLAWAALPAMPPFLAGAALGADDNVRRDAFIHYGTVLDKLGAALSPFYFPGTMPLAATLTFFLVAAAMMPHRVSIERKMLPVLGLLAVLAVAAPSVLFDIWGADLRLPLVLLLLLIASLTPMPDFSARTRGPLLACLAVLVGIRSAGAWTVLHALDRQAEDVRGVVDRLPLGARLLVVDPGTADAPARIVPPEMTRQFGFLAAIDRDAFVPFPFIGNTPLRIRPEFDRTASIMAAPIDMAQLGEGLAQGDPPSGPPPYGWGGHKYWLGWPGKFDYVLIEHFGAAMGPMPAALRLVARGPIADLYRVAVTR